MSAAEQVDIFATLVAKAGKADELRAILTELVKATKAEPGNIQYILHEDPKQPGAFYVFEAYRDQAAADTHMKSPHLAAAFQKAGPLLEDEPSITQTRIVAGS